MKDYLFLLLLLSFFACQNEPTDQQTDVLILGDGTGATSAAIQSARSGAQTILVTSLPWLGGMLTSAGVSATDGNHQLPAGLWGEFRDSLRRHYGGEKALFTGWVSNTQFEPSVGNDYWQRIAANEENLKILYEVNYQSIAKENSQWKVEVKYGNKTIFITAQILIDGTDLGDVAAAVGAEYDVGMEANKVSGESMSPPQSNDILQDLTYAIILKDFGENADKTIPKPENYDPMLFDCACDAKCSDPTAKSQPCPTMLNYGKLPGEKYMINWPIKGNDYYANVLDMTREERAIELEKAKNKTLQFVYYIQHELGFKNLGIAKNEFPSKDGFPLMPYHREGRRIKGLVRSNVNHLIQPYAYNLYRTGIAVGDYPIDHHHYERPDAPDIDFPKVPSFSVPLGALIPENIDNLIIADKAISVSNIVNGASRLQPVIIQIGQVAGLLAAKSVRDEKLPSEVDIRTLQKEILAIHGYLLPFIDVPPTHPHFESIQKIGATGLLRGEGIPYKWANQTWFYPDSTIQNATFLKSMNDFNSNLLIEEDISKSPLTIEKVIAYVNKLSGSATTDIDAISAAWEREWRLSNFDLERLITRAELAVLLDRTTNVFERTVDWEGEFKE